MDNVSHFSNLLCETVTFNPKHSLTAFKCVKVETLTGVVHSYVLKEQLEVCDLVLAKLAQHVNMIMSVTVNKLHNF